MLRVRRFRGCFKWIIPALALSLVLGCALPGGRAYLEQLRRSGWTVSQVAGDLPPVVTAISNTLPTDGPLLVYIEGDGHAWARRNLPSDDPTPREPVALQLAEASSARFASLYISRPCQFVVSMTDVCDPHVWTSARYSKTAVDAISNALDESLRRATIKRHAGPMILVGYSGGGVIAMALAASRRDVAAIITIAAPLDTETWTRFHGVSPLVDAINPASITSELTNVPQLHLAGSEDSVVPPVVAESYIRAANHRQTISLEVLEGFDHHCCWVDTWPKLLIQALSRLTTPVSSIEKTQFTGVL